MRKLDDAWVCVYCGYYGHGDEEHKCIPPEPTIQRLTKRELFAAMAMQGILSNTEACLTLAECTDTNELKEQKLAKGSLTFADALLKELEKSNENRATKETL